ncbi:MAG: molecular chaperone DnaJ [Cyanobacteria bacterium CRU_2_1]|nr:molecular chaperone DnaJ [Cyanobacteria bacterium RU_5_0]NJR58026.1 molecular chaperone DnaJ [Cyanobacteria bacterium CRU_2_1]
MTSPHDRLGISPDAAPAEVKTAYHAKLREFPAHTHPEEFKAVRAAYDAIRKGETAKDDDFLNVRPLEVTLDPDSLKQLREKALAQIDISLDELIRETF